MNLTPFDGATYTPSDGPRLSHQWLAIFGLMRDGRWRTLGQIQQHFNALGQHFPESSISARLRDFRKPQYGGYTMNKSNRGNGLWVYQLIVPAREPVQAGLL